MSTPRRYFDDLYRHDEDPWRYRTSWYERRKRDLVLASLSRERYESAFEPACSNGELSAMIARRCSRLRACDVSEAAVRGARERLGDAPNVTLEQRAVPDEWPDDARFDLIVVSELAYYLSPEATARLAQRAWHSLADDGEFVACHWRHPFEGKLQRAEDIHAAFDAAFDGTRTVQHAEADFLLDVWSKDGRSIARREGIA
ncbi:SAM-dependent methyltransferase [Caballeronia concitans]|uniref:Nodulation protein S (NodS) n=1 Tax=Caballeronia concitans TaxID=1777133 RepID=A0A658QTC0_9BURK|nr:class I SAM-dependent methyltransferase [Caballeronia concitans]KIG10833.1 NodS family protein [Burkholderia sp. MR1]SAL19765.1 Nodulation protein S (NodS) [Caballeronia concitans]